ncbi:MAG: NAD-glutamate dehydrogenase, partial [Smithellaceae bacterium]|nr:NAD-glutamate dehydrogenase [Smithellaceae bacterium]
LGAKHSQARENLKWLFAHLHPYFFITMKEETEAILNLALGLESVADKRKLVLAEQERKLILARLDLPGSLYDTLIPLQEMEISYAEMIHSDTPLPGSDQELEIHRFDFDRKTNRDINTATGPTVPAGIRKAARKVMKDQYADFDLAKFEQILRLLWLNNQEYVRISPPERIVRNMWLYQQGLRHDGLFLDAQEIVSVGEYRETRILFAVVNPAQRGFMTQVMEVFKRLKIGVRRYYGLNISTGLHPYFLGTFYVTASDRTLLEKESDLFKQLQGELYNTQILSPSSEVYTNFVMEGIMTGEEASLVNAFAAFCHTALAHSHPDRFSYDVVRNALFSDPALTFKLIEVFNKRFNPGLSRGVEAYQEALRELAGMIDTYNTGSRYLDEIRKTIYQICLIFISHTLKTNFFVPRKHALSFRLDPTYLGRLRPEFTAGLPRVSPFRITFFFGRYGLGYHIGFSDIARGGWRTIICKHRDEYTTNINTLFREVFILAHTQHLKNKDIYEGGSKMTVVLDAVELEGAEDITQRLFKLQYGFINAFFDIFVTEKGKARAPQVVDYYGEEEPIELGPDENMHDEMIELVAGQALRRGYILGIGVMSSKRVGINHKEYGVTSRGVVKYAEIALREIGIRIDSDCFTVKFTGGPYGDVAGNSMNLLLKRCPEVKINCIVDGTAGLFDPAGADRNELERLLLKEDISSFAPEALHPGGFIVYRHIRRQSGLRELHRRVSRHEGGLEEEWLTIDEFYRELDQLMFSSPSDLFLPCGGRPETIDGKNWHKLFTREDTPLVKVITEGANSFIAPEARDELQKRGIIVIRDASANKCGVISSSYEIIANLLMSEKEFLTHKEAYIADVLQILDTRAEEEAGLIFQRHREQGGNLSYTQISGMISEEINEHYGRLFAFFQSRPELADQLLFRRTILQHLPEFISSNAKYRRRVGKLPQKIKFAILASEISSSIVYRGGWETDLAGRLRAYLKGSN